MGGCGTTSSSKQQTVKEVVKYLPADKWSWDFDSIQKSRPVDLQTLQSLLIQAKAHEKSLAAKVKALRCFRCKGPARFVDKGQPFCDVCTKSKEVPLSQLAKAFPTNVLQTLSTWEKRKHIFKQSLIQNLKITKTEIETSISTLQEQKHDIGQLASMSSQDDIELAQQLFKLQQLYCRGEAELLQLQQPTGQYLRRKQIIKRVKLNLDELDQMIQTRFQQFRNDLHKVSQLDFCDGARFTAQLQVMERSINHSKQTRNFSITKRQGAEGQVKEAEDQFSKFQVEIKMAMQGVNKSQPDHIRKGLLFVILNKHKEAVHQLKLAIRDNPADIQAYDILCHSYKHLYMYQEGILTCKKSISIQPRNPSAYLNLGNFQSQLGQWDQAAQSYEAAIKLNPNKEAAHLYYGVALDNLQKHEKAIEVYQHILKNLNSRNINALVNKAKSLCSLNRFSQAVEISKKAVNINHRCADAYAQLSQSYLGLQNYRQAADTARIALKYDRMNEKALSVLSESLKNIGQEREASEAQDKLMKLKKKK